MKNLLIYLNPSRSFAERYAPFVKIQIDNSLNLGWKIEDIMLVTNFPYEYRGVNAIVLDDSVYCAVHNRASKITAILELFKKGLIEKGQLYWFHDFDAYQLHPITAEELKLDNIDAGFTDYGWSSKWNTGSFFFKDSARDVFEWINDSVNKLKTDEERGLMALTDSNFNNINSRIKRLNSTYNIGMRRTDRNYKIAEKPLKVLHFHPNHDRVDTLKNFMYGYGKLGFPLMTEELITLFKSYGFSKEPADMIRDMQSLEIRHKRRKWKPFFQKYKIKSVCEIGVRRGENFKRMIESNPSIAVAVDSWIDDGIMARNDSATSQENLDLEYLNFKSEMADKPFVKICRGYSFDIVKEFPDEYFDLIYIDADHSFNGCLRDINNWYPKVKKGGFLTGDDYVNSKTKTGVRFGVIAAVQAFLDENKLQEYFFDLPIKGWGIFKK